jgi:hypothetical protein
MKYMNWKMILLAAVPCLMWLSQAMPAQGADNDPAAPGDRIQRLERRLEDLANRQEQIMRRLEAQRGEQPGLMRPPAAANAERPLVRPESSPEDRRAERPAEAIAHLLGLMFLVGVLCNILLAIWIFTDIRKRGEGHGIFVALALIAGIPTAIIYSLVRIGDKAATAPK